MNQMDLKELYKKDTGDDWDCVGYPTQSYVEWLESKVNIVGLDHVRLSLPTDEEIEAYIIDQPYYGTCTHEYNEGIEQGAKWVIDRIKGNEA